MGQGRKEGLAGHQVLLTAGSYFCFKQSPLFFGKASQPKTIARSGHPFFSGSCVFFGFDDVLNEYHIISYPFVVFRCGIIKWFEAQAVWIIRSKSVGSIVVLMPTRHIGGYRNRLMMDLYI